MWGAWYLLFLPGVKVKVYHNDPQVRKKAGQDNEIFMWLFSLFILFILFSVPEPVDAANPSTHPRNTILMMHAILITQTGFHKEERSEMCFDISEGHYEECVKEIQGCSVR